MSETLVNSNRIDKPFFTKLKTDSKILSNINFILEKMDRDGHLKTLKSAFDSVLYKEIDFAVVELYKIQKKIKNFDVKGQLVNNTFIFKENLKTIANFIGKIIS